MNTYQSLAKSLEAISNYYRDRNPNPVGFIIELNENETTLPFLYKHIWSLEILLLKSATDMPPSSPILVHDNDYNSQLMVCMTKSTVKEMKTIDTVQNGKYILDNISISNYSHYVQVCPIMSLKSEHNKDGHPIITDLTFYTPINGVIFHNYQLFTDINRIMDTINPNDDQCRYDIIMTLVKTMLVLRFNNYEQFSKVCEFLNDRTPSLYLWKKAILAVYYSKN